MVNSKLLFRDFLSELKIHDVEEAVAIGKLVFEKYFNLTWTDIQAEKMVSISDADKNQIAATIKRLNAHEPVQYVLGEAEFFGRHFFVNKTVLIPRPETEELVRHAIDLVRSFRAPRILDIGTGSGCIAITLALEIPKALVTAIDVSDSALDVARINARSVGANVDCLRVDILAQDLPLGIFDLIVSNPPYITTAEITAMEANVLDHEPKLALFVSNNDPLQFYKAIAHHAQDHLVHGGWVAFEINWQYGKDVADLLKQSGFHRISILQDMSGKDRIVIGQKFD